MNIENAVISLELLLLNDLFRTEVIDETIYALAVQKITSTKKLEQNIRQPKVLSA